MIAPPPLVSVVIATHNRRALLAEAIATVFGQTGSAWELIVVDDASTDDTAAFLATLQDFRVRTFHEETNVERSRARNRGLSEARGEFIMFLDDDDLLRPNALEYLAAGLREHANAVAATAPCRILIEDGDSVKVYWPSRLYVRTIWRELLFGFWANSGQSLFRTSVVRSLGGFDPSLAQCEDRKLWLQVTRRGPVCLLPSVALEYRVHAGQKKAANLDDIRRRVWRAFIEELPNTERRQALRTRESAELIERAQRCRVEGGWGRALILQLRGCRRAPWLLVSPLTARPLWWGLKKCLLRSTAP